MVRSVSSLLVGGVAGRVFRGRHRADSESGQIAFSGLLLAFPMQSSVFEMVNCLGNTWRFLITSSVSGDRVIAALWGPRRRT